METHQEDKYKITFQKKPNVCNVLIQLIRYCLIYFYRRPFSWQNVIIGEWRG